MWGPKLSKLKGTKYWKKLWTQPQCFDIRNFSSYMDNFLKHYTFWDER